MGAVVYLDTGVLRDIASRNAGNETIPSACLQA